MSDVVPGARTQQTGLPSQTRPLTAAPVGAMKTAPPAAIEATAQLLTFAPGFYAVDFTAARSAETDTGLRLPCARLEPIPNGANSTGRCFIAIMAEGGWLCQADQPVFVRAVGSTAVVMLTVYMVAGDTAPPEIRIRKIEAGGVGDAAPPNLVRPTMPAAVNTAPWVPLVQLAHIRGLGDVEADAADWVGQPGSQRQIEGFALKPGAGLMPEDVEYQAILGHQWNTPWSSGGGFCGSRGMGLPLLGFRVRLLGKQADRYTCEYWGSFANKGIIGPFRDGAACEADGTFLDALRVVIAPRAPSAAAPARLAGNPDAAISATPGKSTRKPRRTVPDK